MAVLGVIGAVGAIISAATEVYAQASKRPPSGGISGGGGSSDYKPTADAFVRKPDNSPASPGSPMNTQLQSLASGASAGMGGSTMGPRLSQIQGLFPSGGSGITPPGQPTDNPLTAKPDFGGGAPSTPQAIPKPTIASSAGPSDATPPSPPTPEQVGGNVQTAQAVTGVQAPTVGSNGTGFGVGADTGASTGGGAGIGDAAGYAKLLAQLYGTFAPKPPQSAGVQQAPMGYGGF